MNDVHFDFTGRTVVVTGAGNGIGAACARLFGASGANVALWDRDAAAATAIATGIDASSRRARALPCDVARTDDVAAALAATLQAFGRVDILINNAGIFRAADFLDISEDDWDAVLDVNLKGSFLVGQAVARAMAATGGGAIVNMSSVNGVTAIPSIASYNASKGGIDQLTRAMALSLADKGIRVNAVAPGTIATELARKAVLGSEEAKARIMGRTPLRRLGDPSEVAAVCAFLMGQAVAREMAKARRGSIVNMSSVNGMLTIPTISSYNVSKGGINQLTRVMALSLADQGVRVNAVAPGTIATELAAKAVLTSEEAKKRILSRTPMKRLGEPSEIADAVAYLASDASSYVTGEIVVVDGGRMTLNYVVAT